MQNQILHQKYFQPPRKECFKISVPMKAPTGPRKSPGDWIYIGDKNNRFCSLRSFSKLPLLRALPQATRLGPCGRRRAVGSCRRHLPGTQKAGSCAEPATDPRAGHRAPGLACLPVCHMGQSQHGSSKGPLCCRDMFPPPSLVHLSVLLSPPEGSVGRVHQCGGAGSAPLYLVLLPTFPLLLNLLLLLQLLRHAGLPQRLALAPFVGFGVEGRL